MTYATMELCSMLTMAGSLAALACYFLPRKPWGVAPEDVEVDDFEPADEYEELWWDTNGGEG